jgi:hypothetical protein
MLFCFYSNESSASAVDLQTIIKAWEQGSVTHYFDFNFCSRLFVDRSFNGTLRLCKNSAVRFGSDYFRLRTVAEVREPSNLLNSSFLLQNVRMKGIHNKKCISQKLTCPVYIIGKVKSESCSISDLHACASWWPSASWGIVSMPVVATWDANPYGCPASF